MRKSLLGLLLFLAFAAGLALIRNATVPQHVMAQTAAVAFDSPSPAQNETAPSARRGNATRFRTTEPKSADRYNSQDYSLAPVAQPALTPFDADFNGDVDRIRASNPQQRELSQLRNEYTEIARSKAALMSLEELRLAVQNADSELQELKAKTELQSAVEKLKQLIERFPDSKAAAKARSILGEPGSEEEVDSEEADSSGIDFNEAAPEEAAADEGDSDSN